MIWQILKTVVVIILGTQLLSCGASKVPNSSTSTSRVTPIPGGSGTENTLAQLAECNKVISNNGLSTTVYLSTYYDYYGQFVSNKINFKFDQVPNGLLSDENLYLQIFPWRIDANGSKQVSNTPLSFYFIQRGTGTINTPQPISSVSLGQISEVISSNNLANFGINTSNFFGYHNLILLNVDLQYDALLLVLYKDQDEGDSEVVGSTEALIPAFFANPDKYKNANPYPSLYNLHPLKSYAGTYANDNEYQNLADQICQGFLSALQRMKVTTTKRLPAASNSLGKCTSKRNVRCINQAQNGDGNINWWQKIIYQFKQFFAQLF